MQNAVSHSTQAARRTLDHNPESLRDLLRSTDLSSEPEWVRDEKTREQQAALHALEEVRHSDDGSKPTSPDDH